ncbi:MAG: hypothetical protein RLZZ126_2093 [Pseudomonadota bacterium]|jgi:hypothetical protein
MRVIRLALECFALLVVVGCGGGGASGAAGPALAANEVAVYVDAGPAGTGYNANRLYTDVTICQPGSPGNCQTIEHVLVDTGSTGLRILATELSPTLGLVAAAASGGSTLANCARFVDGSFAWGPVTTADIVLGSLRAASTRFQVMGDPSLQSSAAACSSGTALRTVSDLGARGILGVGLFREDCGTACVGNAAAGFYFSCLPGVSCTGTTVATSSQVRNPIVNFSLDNNGVLIDLPSVGLSPAGALAGKMIFGVATQSNNQLAGAQVFQATSRGYVTTIFNGVVMSNSFLDTGSNGLYFDTPILTQCNPGSAAGFYCPAVSTALTATVSSSNGNTTSIGFVVANALASFAGAPPVLPGLAGTFGASQSFDWGLPFFYGRRVFFGIQGMAATGGVVGPYYAF